MATAFDNYRNGIDISGPGASLRPGVRLAIHPAWDMWMRGERYATITKIGRKLVHMKGERSGKAFRATLTAVARDCEII